VRIKNDFPRFNFSNFSNLTFESPDIKTFRNLALAFEAMNRSGNCPCVINAANEMVVDAFLKDRIGFLQMSDVIEECMEKVTFVSKPSYEDYVHTDKEARRIAQELIIQI
jgi:1-deoxy-D-xylulose-5-phosphate reductoisomerase